MKSPQSNQPNSVPAPVLPDALPAFLRAAAEPNRLRILALLAQGECCVGEVETALSLPQNLVSHHLSMLKGVGLVRSRRDGKWVFYRIEPQTLGEHLGALYTLLDTRRAPVMAPVARASSSRAPLRTRGTMHQGQ